MPGNDHVQIHLASMQIESGPDYLRCVAVPRPLTKLVVVGILVCVVVCGPLVIAIGNWQSELRYGRQPSIADKVEVGLCVALLIGTIVALAIAIQRYCRPRTFTIADGQIHALTPEQPTAEHTLACADVRAAELRIGRGMQPGIGNLVLVRHHGLPVVAFTGFPTGDLAQVVDAVNRFVRIDQFKAFEVLVPGTDVLNGKAIDEPNVPMAVLRVEQPLRVLPVEPGPQ